jgi:adenylylsulfate kinase-like enzyme
MANSSVFEEIYKKHSKILENKNIKNEKLIICFSGIPGSGKTTVAKKLERRYRGVRINTHDLGKIIETFLGRKLQMMRDTKSRININFG